MEIGILGTGVVGQTIAAKLSELGHSVMVGTRDVAATRANTEAGPYGNPAFSVWLESHPSVQLGTFAEAAAHGEVLINALSGHASQPVISSLDEAAVVGKILIDISNPLDFSQGMPPSLFINNTDSLAEHLQAAQPSLKVVKTLNTLNANLMVNPNLVAAGDHHLFVSGNDAEAKAAVIGYLKMWFGWQHIIDLGDITTARGTEMLLPIWIRLLGALQTPMFNFKIVQ